MTNTILSHLQEEPNEQDTQISKTETEAWKQGKD